MQRFATARLRWRANSRSGPTRALVATRRLIDESEHASYADQFRREIETQAEIRLSADAVEGRNAFLEKRAAVFTGR
jgi:2-(1,2-epoxy-1,2-dihydrophenyl)acetyl-CoA isomerase